MDNEQGLFIVADSAPTNETTVPMRAPIPYEQRIEFCALLAYDAFPCDDDEAMKLACELMATTDAQLLEVCQWLMLQRTPLRPMVMKKLPSVGEVNSA